MSGALELRIELHKLGSWIDATDADLGCDGTHLRRCGVHLHAVSERGVRVSCPTGQLTIAPKDSAHVSVGGAQPLATPMRAPDPAGGVHFGLVGNILNKNKPYWYPFDERDRSSQFRFELSFREHAAGGGSGAGARGPAARRGDA